MGRISTKDDQIKLIPDSIEIADKNTLPECAKVNNETQSTQKKKRRGLFLKVTEENEIKIEAIKNLLSIFDGDLPVYFYHENSKQYEFLGNDCSVWVNEPLKQELQSILGEDNIVIQN